MSCESRPESSGDGSPPLVVAIGKRRRERVKKSWGFFSNRDGQVVPALLPNARNWTVASPLPPGLSEAVAESVGNVVRGLAAVPSGGRKYRSIINRVDRERDGGRGGAVAGAVRCDGLGLVRAVQPTRRGVNVYGAAVRVAGAGRLSMPPWCCTRNRDLSRCLYRCCPWRGRERRLVVARHAVVGRGRHVNGRGRRVDRERDDCRGRAVAGVVGGDHLGLVVTVNESRRGGDLENRWAVVSAGPASIQVLPASLLSSSCTVASPLPPELSEAVAESVGLVLLEELPLYASLDGGDLISIVNVTAGEVASLPSLSVAMARAW